MTLLLSLTGIYSNVAFSVSRRTREIGIRIALGADARRVVAAIFARPSSTDIVRCASTQAAGPDTAPVAGS